jgi:2-polyprenyl-3-methyl-5-hydroxy-6-metoxy-1,4-benzoquinol methylase
MESISSTQTCWCSDRELQEFSPDYSLCSQCGTLVLTKGLSLDEVRVKDDDRDFYSKEYWLSYQTDEYGYPDIHQRSRQDMPGRCLYWLQTLMRYKFAPGKVLELGCCHGGSVALMEWAGFEATGLELSPWVVDFAKKTFDIPMLLGPLEDRQIEPASLDAIVLYDVLEHLPDPLSTIRHAASLLKEDGIFIIQTPDYIEGKTYLDLVTGQDRFLDQLKPDEHIYLFNRRSVSKFFRSVGFDFIQFERQLFDYDMYFIVSRHSIVRNTDEQIAHNLLKRPSGRMILALLDSSAALTQLQTQSQVEIQDTQVQLTQSQAQLAAAQKQVQESQQQLQQLQDRVNETERILAEQRQVQESQQQLQDRVNETERILAEQRQIQQSQQSQQHQLQQLQDRVNETEADCQEIEHLAAEQQQVQQSQQSQQQKLQQLQDRVNETERILAEQRQIQQSQQSQQHQLQELQLLQNRVSENECLVEDINAEIDSMKTSKFWKLREQWFKLKAAFGLVSSD